MSGSVTPAAPGTRAELKPMQTVWLAHPDFKRARKVTLVGPPWVGEGTPVKHEGRVWIVTKVKMTQGVTLPGFGH